MTFERLWAHFRSTDEVLADLSERATGWLMPGTVVVGTLLYAATHLMRLETQVQTLGFGLALLGALSMAVSLRNERAARWVLVLAWLAATLAVPLVAPAEATLALLLLPVVLAALLLEPAGATLLAAVITLALMLSPIGTPLARLVTLLLVWGATLLSWALSRHLVNIQSNAWRTYRDFREQLESARDQRLQLKETQADLVQATVEMTRLADRLAEMRRVAEDARRVKEEFVANVSHELRTPLNMIVGFVENILNAPQSYGGQVPPLLLADLQVVHRNSQHLSSLIDDILDLSQIEAGRWALVKEHVPISNVIETATSAVRPLFRGKGLKLELDLAEDLPRVFCDRTRIRGVIINLLSNAGRFTEQGGVTVEARRESSDVVIAVIDTGPGIAEDDLQRLFRPFEQLDSSLRRKHGGSGLGLSISKAFVELHGGRMTVESILGVGTRFVFHLPVHPPGELKGDYRRWFQDHVGAPERHHQPQSLIGPLRPRYVVLDPHQELQRMLHRYVDEVELVSVSSLDAAVIEMGAHPAQALLVNATGDSALWDRLYRGTALPYGTPAITCAFPPVQGLTANMGVSDHLVKPVSSERLLSALERLDLPGKTVLVVDDEPDALRLFHRMLTTADRGYQVVRATDGEEAIRAIEREPPDVVLLDLVMPQMDGFAFLEWRNDHPLAGDIPVLVTSAQDPAGQPIVSKAISLVRGGGLSVSQVLAGIEALVKIAGGARREDGSGSGGVSHD